MSFILMGSRHSEMVYNWHIEESLDMHVEIKEGTNERILCCGYVSPKHLVGSLWTLT